MTYVSAGTLNISLYWLTYTPDGQRFTQTYICCLFR